MKSESVARKAIPRLSPHLVVVLGVLVASTSSIMVKSARAEGVPPVVIAALRLTLASLILLPLAWSQAQVQWRALSRSDWLWGGVAGLALALHFGAWISSLDHTSVMSSVVLVSTSPLFVAAASAWLLRERPRSATVIGILLAVAGGVMIGASDFDQRADSFQGNLLALVGALGIAVYMLVGRRLRKKLTLLPYISLVYGLAAAALLIFTLALSTPLTGYSPPGYLWVVLITLGPQLLGHSSFNYALKYVSATLVSVLLLSEPVFATILAIPALGEVPGWTKIAGGILILGGVLLAIRGE